MKRFAWTWIALLGVGALIAFTFWDGKRSDQKQLTELRNKFVLRLTRDAITRIELRNKERAIVLERPAAVNEWRMNAPLVDDADQEAVQTFLNQATAEQVTETVVEGTDLNLPVYGLDRPVNSLKIASADGQSQELRIGAVKAYNNNLYAQIDHDPRIVMVTSAWDYLLSKLAKDFRDKAVLKKTVLNPEHLRRIVLTRGQGSQSETFELKFSDGRWQVAGAEKIAVNPEKVASFIDQLKALRGVDFVSGEMIGKARAALKKPEISLALYADGQNPVFSLKLAPEIASKVGAYYAFAAGGKDVLVVNPGSAAGFEKTAQDFYDRRRAFQFHSPDVERAEFATRDFKGVFEKKDGKWVAVDTDPGVSRSVESSEIAVLIDKLSRMEALRILKSREQAAGLPARFSERIALKKKSGETVFEFGWAPGVEVEKASAHRPEARYLVAASNLSDHDLGIAEGELKALALAEITAVPAPTATPAH